MPVILQIARFPHLFLCVRKLGLRGDKSFTQLWGQQVCLALSTRSLVCDLMQVTEGIQVLWDPASVLVSLGSHNKIPFPG